MIFDLSEFVGRGIFGGCLFVVYGFRRFGGRGILFSFAVGSGIRVGVCGVGSRRTRWRERGVRRR